MHLYKVYIQKDAVYDAIEQIGEYGNAHFVMKTAPPQFKPYKNQIIRCDSILKKIASSCYKATAKDL
jgi:hypothetical protein